MDAAFEKEIDVKGGDLTYGQRLELGSILANVDKREEFELFLDTMECLYGRKPEDDEIKKCIPLFKSALDGINFWIKAESEYLKYESTAEEKEAGVEKYIKSAGEISTVYSIAKDFCKDPDEILGWKYGKVFGYLRKQKADSDFQKRYNNVLTKKAKSRTK